LQVLRDALAAEPAELDHSLYSFPLGHPGEVQSALTLALLKATATGHRVDQEVGHIDLAACPLEARWIGHIALMELAAIAL
jgi:hypothetical protein